MLLPSASLNPATNPDFPDFLIYESEQADGFEAGIKANLLDGAMRLHATAFTYTYSDLQTQLFDSAAIQFTTLNASELVTRGVEADVLWMAALDVDHAQAAKSLLYSGSTNLGRNRPPQKW
ncbi:MAG: TonB-dependent receptor [SAR324 cluster bacterium]|nr:TonB-dependent receptor [SAR324 cluster bacterium]